MTHYFCTAPHLVAGPPLRPTAGAPVHAKAMGTRLTACGLDASSWPKLWDVPFPFLASGCCPACWQIATRGGHRDAIAG